MDIKANLEEQERLAAEIVAIQDGDDDDVWCSELPAMAVRLAELVQAAAAWRRMTGQR